MGLDFKLKDFVYPFDILGLKRIFDRNERLDEEELYAYQARRLRLIIAHAYRNVPYYQKLFKSKGIIPSDIACAKDLPLIPFLTKGILRESFHDLTAAHVLRYTPKLLSTSGTTASTVQFYADKFSNILEFAYYWRAWGWAGYRLGDTFAELSAQFFAPHALSAKKAYHFQPFTRRLLINSLLLSPRNAELYIQIFKRMKPKFLKGLSSNLYLLALILAKHKHHRVSLQGVFSQGENLLRYQRDLIEKVFSCNAYDSYGQMERVVAISQCPQMKYHLHSDYGVAEFLPSSLMQGEDLQKDEYMGEVVGTSLYNFSMPLVRYKMGDFVRLAKTPEKCPCGRNLPVIKGIVGRQADVIVTPDGRGITALYLALDRTPGLILGQIIQEKREELIVKAAYNTLDTSALDSQLLKNLRDFVGDSIAIRILHLSPEEIASVTAGKFKSVVSYLPSDCIMR